MSHQYIEIESKFYVDSLTVIEARLQALGALCLVPRQMETNLRFDDPQNRLEQEHKILRLRRSDDVRLTFKSGKNHQAGVATRTEIEVILSDFETARALLEGLGYQVTFIYEKYRAIYQIDAAQICLDQLPLGNFIEIEAESSAEIAHLADALGLNFSAASAESYHGLFQRLRQNGSYTFRDLTFENFNDLKVTARDLNLTRADP